MSIAVGMEELAQRVREYGPVALVVSISENAAPHVVSAFVAFDDGVLVSDVGSTTGRNATDRPSVTLVWPGRPDDAYCLIADGTASVVEAGDQRTLRVEPLRAVLHRVAGAPDDNPSCVTVLDRRS